jgi:nicotinamide-nucleotide amidase
MRAEIISTGTELLLGQIDDTNATYLARQLRDLGIDLFFRTTVGDNELRIAGALDLALSRADLAIMTGGLGPTVDDVTREAVARVTGRPLVLHPELLAQIEAFFCRVGSRMTDNNRRQACLPEGCIPIENPVGTAPAFIVEDEKGTIITLPGVPHEMRYLMENAVVPYLQKRLGHLEAIVTRVLRTVAVGESFIDHAIADLETSSNPTVGLSAHLGQTDVRIVAKAATPEQAEAMVARFEGTIRERLGAAIYVTGDASLEEVVAGLLRERGATLAVAETVTQGDVVRRLSAYPDVLLGGVVGADGPHLARPLCLQTDAVAGQVGAVTLAEEVRRSWGVTFGLAIVADADTGEPSGPWVAVAAEGGVDARHLRFRGQDRRARTWTTVVALEFMRRLLLGLAEGWSG